MHMGSTGAEVGRAEWSAVPRPVRRPGLVRFLVAALPLLVVVGPVVGMLLHGIEGGDALFCLLVGLAGLGAVVAIEQNDLPRALMGGAALLVALVVGQATTPWYGIWLGVGVGLAGVLRTVPAAGLWVARAAEAVGRVVSVALFSILSVFVVLLPWAVNSLVRVDPLRAPGPKGQRWLALRRRDLHANQPWATEAVANKNPLGYRARATLIWPVLIIGALVLVDAAGSGSGVSIGGTGGPTDVRPAPLDPAITTGPDGKPYKPFDGAPWYPEWVRDMGWVMTTSTGWQPLQAHRIGDVATKWVNIEDGVRKTWHPPACGDCKRLKVWLYGGSTAFGLGQRDAHTIASELARAAWKDGIALDVDNRGVVGDVHWQESDRYAWDLATYGPPDLVIFYDGINDTTATQTLVNSREGDRYAEVNFQNDDFWNRYLEQNPQKAPPPLPGAKVLHPPTKQIDTPDEFADLMWTRFDRARKISRNLSSDDHVPTYYVWQPNRLSRPQVPGEPEDGPGSLDGRRREKAITSRIPKDVIDLSDVFDGNQRALFYDDQHHNEIGARLVGEALYQQLRADIAKLEQGQPVTAAP